MLRKMYFDLYWERRQRDLALQKGIKNGEAYPDPNLKNLSSIDNMRFIWFRARYPSGKICK